MQKKRNVLASKLRPVKTFKGESLVEYFDVFSQSEFHYVEIKCFISWFYQFILTCE